MRCLGSPPLPPPSAAARAPGPGPAAFMGSGFPLAGPWSQTCGLTVLPADGQAFPSTRLWPARAEGDRATVPPMGLRAVNLGAVPPGWPPAHLRLGRVLRGVAGSQRVTCTPPGSQWHPRDRALRCANPFRDGEPVTSRGGRPSVPFLVPPPLVARPLLPQPESVRPTGQAHTLPPPQAGKGPTARGTA